MSQAIKDKLYPYIGTTGPIAVVAPEVKDLIRGLDQLNRSIGAAGGPLPRPVDATRLQITEVHGRKDKLLRWEAPAGQGLELTQPEVTELDLAVRDKMLSEIVSRFDRDAKRAGTGPFASLPAEIQTAIVSFCWQQGEYTGDIKPTASESQLKKKAVWDAMVRRDWGEVVERIIVDFSGGDDRKRRYDEINLIWQGSALGDGITLSPRGQQFFEKAILRTRIAGGGASSSSQSGSSSSASGPVSLGLT